MDTNEIKKIAEAELITEISGNIDKYIEQNNTTFELNLDRFIMLYAEWDDADFIGRNELKGLVVELVEYNEQGQEIWSAKYEYERFAA